MITEYLGGYEYEKETTQYCQSVSGEWQQTRAIDPDADEQIKLFGEEFAESGTSD